MKRILIVSGILVAVFCVTMWHSTYLIGFTSELTVMLEQAEASAEAGDWATAADLTGEAQSRWLGKENYLHITLRHADTDQVYTGFYEVVEFIQHQESGEYSAANAKLIALIELIGEMEQLNLKNLL